MNLPLIWGATSLLVIGLALLLRQLFFVVADITSGGVNYVKRFVQPAAVQWLKRDVFADEEDPNVVITKELIWKRLSEMFLFWVALGVVAGLIASDRLVSPTLFAVIVVFGELYRAGVRRKRLTLLNDQVENLVMQFASRFPIKRSVVSTMSEIATSMPKGELKKALFYVTDLIQLNRPPKKAVLPLAAFPNTTLKQFANVIASAQETDPQVLDDVLALLQKDIKSRSGLFGEIRQSLTVLRVTTRVLQVVLTAALAAASLAISWRNYWIASHSNTMTYYVMLALAVAGSLYVEIEIRQLEES